MNPESAALTEPAVLAVSASRFTTQISTPGFALFENSAVARDPAFAPISVRTDDVISIWS